MDTTLRLKAMEKESLTSKFLFDRCCIFFILVQYMLVSVQCMKRSRSLPLITFNDMTLSKMFLGRDGEHEAELG